MEVFLITTDDEIYLGTVDDLICCNGGASFASVLSDIVGSIQADPIENAELFAIEIR